MVGIPGEPDEGPVITLLPHLVECNGSILMTINLDISDFYSVPLVSLSWLPGQGYISS